MASALNAARYLKSPPVYARTSNVKMLHVAITRCHKGYQRAHTLQTVMLCTLCPLSLGQQCMSCRTRVVQFLLFIPAPNSVQREKQPTQ